MKQHYDDSEEIDLPPSKTKVKKQMHDLQDLGEQLVDLSKEHLAEIEIPDNLRLAVQEVKKIKSFGAIKRQMQYIGKLMRDVDPAPIQAKLAEWNGTSRQHIAWLHQVERWRDRLLAEPEAITELLSAHPGADIQRLRTLIRNAIKEKESSKPPKSYREIFQVLRDVIPEEPLIQPSGQDSSSAG
jgi:ribosome-associated protein